MPVTRHADRGGVLWRRARLAGAVSLVLGSAKLADHVADGDGLAGRPAVAGVARRLAGRWARQGSSTADLIGFDTTTLITAIESQALVEASVGLGDPILEVTAPAETATAAAFAHTTVLAGLPVETTERNAAALTEAGRLFGRVAHLLDAVADLDEDRRTGAWNPLVSTGAQVGEVRRLCDDAVLGVELALREVEFHDGALVHALLVHELAHAVTRTLGDPHGRGRPSRERR